MLFVGIGKLDSGVVWECEYRCNCAVLILCIGWEESESAPSVIYSPVLRIDLLCVAVAPSVVRRAPSEVGETLVVVMEEHSVGGWKKKQVVDVTGDWVVGWMRNPVVGGRVVWLAVIVFWEELVWWDAVD